MSGYRFCRTDDVPLLVDAHNRCYPQQVAGAQPIDADDLKRAILELNIWTSSCMVASHDHQPIGVLIAAKRDEANWIYRIAVHPDHQRQGHAAHMLTSLSRKLAILGPPRIRAEIPESYGTTRALFEHCGFRIEQHYTDYAGPCGPGIGEQAAIVIPITVNELADNDALQAVDGCCWRRELQTLRNRAEMLSGVAVASDVRIEAYVLYTTRADEPTELVAWGCVDPARSERLLDLLVRHVAGLTPQPLRIRCLLKTELDPKLLERWGFKATRQIFGYSIVAEP